MRSDYKSARAGIYLVALQMLILNAVGLQIRPSGLYNKTAKELIQQQPNLNDIIEKRRNNYE